MLSKVALGVAAFSASTEAAAAAAGGPVVLTGATGRTGSLVYKLLKEQGSEVRALVRDAKKAAAVLGCSKCDESEGIFVGDIMKAETLEPIMHGAESLIILTSAVPKCDAATGKCTYPEGAFPIDIDFHGGKNQISAFAKAAGADKQVVLVSAKGTTQPNSYLDLLGNGQIGFYKLNLEASLESSGLPFTILKPCGLGDGDAGKQEMLVGHDDAEDWDERVLISRADVARLAVAALKEKAIASGLRFDVCAKDGTPTQDADLKTLLKQARLPWMPPAQHTVVV
eukprot:TRINITY_DN111283_c0_g1_i1.p1 TRINITY_DN111283_c0_g1~~TRINITY_DN111283_c0_g1_i1.p1  ORF type:complete len:283 (+),score=90.30 TRINITY_DN111283_c0_g1_i1:67-915(+)